MHFQERINVNCGLGIIMKFESKRCNANEYVNDFLKMPNKWLYLNYVVVH